ncbi:hypothetical protein SERLA73DRAFT_155536 [Serpula lacrymans var. lacrymans S7.3]|uniref:Uncharacterized protein n=1 Tax=Serpula lacrymans var. lacrymans (strain S7.3) TaxID=936435 RepID=F8QAN4_SERL3|nr:hypothetical protein SERLA73DRAFT_155536 [Serpula lacrymans var. lacrymans S7.3]
MPACLLLLPPFCFGELLPQVWINTSYLLNLGPNGCPDVAGLLGSQLFPDWWMQVRGLSLSRGLWGRVIGDRGIVSKDEFEGVVWMKVVVDGGGLGDVIRGRETVADDVMGPSPHGQLHCECASLEALTEKYEEKACMLNKVKQVFLHQSWIDKEIEIVTTTLLIVAQGRFENDEVTGFPVIVGS